MPRQGQFVQRKALQGCSILIVGDEPLLVMDIESEFIDSGAELTIASMLHATIFVEHDGISAAILDYEIGEKTWFLLYNRLNERGIPFIIYTGHIVREEDRKGGLLISKPAMRGVLVDAVKGLIRPINHTEYQPWGEPCPAV